MALPDSQESSQIRVERQGAVAIVYLDNPPLNIITATMRPQLLAALDEADADTSMRAVILTGHGDRAFCAGADLNEEAELSPETVRQFLDDDCALFDRLESLRVPVIAAINGHCMGGGLELALSCDIRITADDAKHVGAGVKVGLVVSTTRITRLVGPAVAKDVLLTGRTFTGADAFRLGLASASVPRADVLAVALEWAQEIAIRAPLAVQHTKRSVAEASDLPFDEAMSRELDHFSVLSGSEDHKHAIAAFFERKEPKFLGR